MNAIILSNCPNEYIIKTVYKARTNSLGSKFRQCDWLAKNFAAKIFFTNQSHSGNVSREQIP